MKTADQRPSFSRHVTVLGVTTMMCASLALAAAPTARADDAPILKVAISSEIDSLNPFLTIYATPINILRYQYEPLVNFGKNNEVVPGMADKFEASEGGKVWTFHLPDGRKWSDGQPVTAEDPAWTLNKMMTDAKMATANGSLVENFDKVEVKDKNTLMITLKTPQAANPGNEIPIVPKHVWEKVDGATFPNDASGGPIVGSGPFFITKYAKGQSIELKTNPNFHRGPAKIGGITYVYYNNTEAAVKGLQAGEVDFVSGLSATQYNTLKNAANIQVSNGAGRRYQAININHGVKSVDDKYMGDGNPVLRDAQVRKAIAMAIDTDTLLSRVLGGLGKHGITQSPTTFPSYFGLPAGASERKFDLAAANKILDEAGYQKGADGIRLDKEGKPINLRLFGRSNDTTHAQVAEFVGPWLKEIGIATTVSMRASSEVGKASTLGNYDLYLGGWGIGPDPDFQLSINQCKSRPNPDGSGATSESGWCNPEFDKLYAAQRVELDEAKRASLVKQAFNLIYQDNVMVVMYYADSLEAYRKDRFTGFQKQPDNNGVIYGQSGYWGLYSTQPVKAGSGSTKGSDSSAGLSGGAIAGIVVGAVVIIGGGWYALSRRGKREDTE